MTGWLDELAADDADYFAEMDADLDEVFEALREAREDDITA